LTKISTIDLIYLDMILLLNNKVRIMKIENIPQVLVDSGLIKNRELEEPYKGKYTLFEIQTDDLTFPIVRLSNGESHLGISGMLLKEFNDYIDLKVEDIQLNQSNHSEPVRFINKDGFNVDILGGGYLSLEKGIMKLYGQSKAFEPESPDVQKSCHMYARQPLKKYLQKLDKDNKIVIEGLEDVKDEKLDMFLDNLQKAHDAGINRGGGLCPCPYFNPFYWMDKGNMEEFEKQIKKISDDNERLGNLFS